jgi:hypothetical protein
LEELRMHPIVSAKMNTRISGTQEDQSIVGLSPLIFTMSMLIQNRSIDIGIISIRFEINFKRPLNSN